jgi:hypothetical protein
MCYKYYRLHLHQYKIQSAIIANRDYDKSVQLFNASSIKISNKYGANQVLFSAKNIPNNPSYCDVFKLSNTKILLWKILALWPNKNQEAFLSSAVNYC